MRKKRLICAESEKCKLYGDPTRSDAVLATWDGVPGPWDGVPTSFDEVLQCREVALRFWDADPSGRDAVSGTCWGLGGSGTVSVASDGLFGADAFVVFPVAVLGAASCFLGAVSENSLPFVAVSGLWFPGTTDDD